MTTVAYSSAYQYFLDFFKLTQRSRLEGLDSSYFVNMSEEEKEMAFEYLREDFETSIERIRGLYLCDYKKALKLFKEVSKKPLKLNNEKWANEIAMEGRVEICGYICNAEPTKENIDNFASIDILNGNRETRRAFYRLVPSQATTKKMVSLLEQALLFEGTLEEPVAGVTSSFLSIHGIDFSLRDENYKRLGRGLLSDEVEIRKATIAEVKSNYTPAYA